MRLVLLSDTHNLHSALGPLPAGDAVLHAGDITGLGTRPEIADFLAWYGSLPYRHKIFIAGNHDFLFERNPAVAEALVPAGITYLRDSALEIEGLKIWGSPWQPWFGDWAFNLERGPRLAEKWARIPDDVDVLITHGPPHGTLDQTADHPPEAAGCEALRERLPALARLRLHQFGHIHEAYGQLTSGSCTFVNASICDRQYRPRNPPIVVEL